CCTNAGVGAADGVTAAEGTDWGPVPTELLADTANVYAVPFVSPLMVVDVPATTVDGCALMPTYGVTVYAVIGLPPSLPGGLHDTAAEALPATAVMPVGAPGAVGGPAGAAGENTTVASCQIAEPPTATVADGVAPAPTALSTVSRSMLPFGDRLPRAVQPLPAVSV